MVKRNELTYPVLYDTTTAVARSWNVYDLLGDGVSAPSMFVFAPAGHLVAAHIGRHAGDRPDAEDILKVAREFMSGPPPEFVESPPVVPTPTTEPTATSAPEAPTPADTPTAAPGQPSPTAAPGATEAPPPDDTPTAAPGQPSPTADRNPIATPTPAAPPSTPADRPTAVPNPTAIPEPTATTAPPITFEDDEDKAFAFNLPNAHGGQVSLDDYEGNKNVVLVFYRAFW